MNIDYEIPEKYSVDVIIAAFKNPNQFIITFTLILKDFCNEMALT